MRSHLSLAASAILAAGSLSLPAWAQGADGARVAHIESGDSASAAASDPAPSHANTPTANVSVPPPPFSLSTEPPIGASAPAPAAEAAAPNAELPDPAIDDIRQRLQKAANSLPKDDRSVLQQYYGAADAKLLWLDAKGLSPRGAALQSELQKADDWGLQARDFELPPYVAADSTPELRADAELKLSIAALKYARFARGGRVDPAVISSYLDRKAQLLPAKRVLDDLRAAAAPDAYLRGLHPQHPQFEKLRHALLDMRKAVPDEAASSDAVPAEVLKPKAALPERGSIRKLIANMEMWRWMPTDLGATHLIVNVPEFQFRLVRDGVVVHSERVITGKPETQTPIFSDMMETVVFKPTWNVPDSIKVKELLPALMRNPGALARQGLKVSYKGRDVDPVSIDWATTDIRALHIFQPPSGDNALGIVKFLFPNKHAVYLHDTPSKALFNQTRRTFSHGCIRVRNPVRLAELLMEADRGWSTAQVKAQFAPAAPEQNNVNLNKKFPVHIAYFTAWASDAGELQYVPDVYGYETNINLALDGKAHLIVRKKEDNLGAVRAATIAPVLVDAQPAAAPANREWMNKVFKDY